MKLIDAHIVVIDDHKTNTLLLEKTLHAEGFNNVIGFNNPLEGLNYLCENPYQLLILDLNMPTMNGFQLMQALKDQGLHGKDVNVPVLVLTAQNERDIRLQALRQGARDFVTKPFDRLELVCRINNLIQSYLLQNEIQEHNRTLEYKIQLRTRELLDTQLEIIRRLGRAAEYRDNDTGSHIIRMSRVSAMLGRELGLSDEECALIESASPMHDVGKIGIPDYILMKNSALNDEERKIMEGHTIIGAEILSGHHSAVLNAAREIALSHHEKWDGSGYPHGLVGTDIPIFGRIVALADVFDALLSVRPYKQSWDVDSTVDYINKEQGRHFDPHLVECFRDILPQILNVREEIDESRNPLVKTNIVLV